MDAAQTAAAGRKACLFGAQRPPRKAACGRPAELRLEERSGRRNSKGGRQPDYVTGSRSPLPRMKGAPAAEWPRRTLAFCIPGCKKSTSRTGLTVFWPLRAKSRRSLCRERWRSEKSIPVRNASILRAGVTWNGRNGRRNAPESTANKTVPPESSNLLLRGCGPNGRGPGEKAGTAFSGCKPRLRRGRGPVRRNSAAKSSRHGCGRRNLTVRLGEQLLSVDSNAD